LKKPDLQFVKDALSELDPELARAGSGEEYDTAFVLLAAIACGTDTVLLTAATGLPRDFVDAIRERMIRAELWTELRACCDHWWVAEQTICETFFWTDFLVARGLVIRRWDEAQGEYRYYATEYAPAAEPIETVN